MTALKGTETAEQRPGGDEPTSLAPAVTRAVAILEELAASDTPLGLSDLARRLGLAKSSLSNLCAALEAADMVRRVDTRYSLGHKLVELGSAYLRRVDLISEFHAVSRTLPVARHETMLLAMLDGLDVVYLARHDGTQPIRLASDVGRRMPAVCTALGKAMLSTLTPAELDARLANYGPFPQLTAKSLSTPAELHAELDRTRRRGFAIDDEENTEGVCCFSFALPGTTTPPLAVSVTLLKARLVERLREELLPDLHTLADTLPKRISASEFV